MEHQVVFTAPGEVRITSEELPSPTADQVLVRTRRSLVSAGTETIVLSGRSAPGSKWADFGRFPFSPGYSNAGEVVAAGPGVSMWKPGDRVVSGARHVTAYLSPQEALLPIPDAVSYDEAAWFHIAIIVLNGVRQARIELGEPVVVVGMGVLGQLAAQFARLEGGYPVVALDLVPDKVNLAKKCGAHIGVIASAKDAHQSIKDLTGGRGASVVIDCTGSAKAFAHVVKLAARLGRVVLLGAPPVPVTVDLHDDIIISGLTVLGCHEGTSPEVQTDRHYWTRTNNARLFLDLVADHLVRTEPLTTHHFAWRETAAAYALLMEQPQQAVGVLLDWD